MNLSNEKLLILLKNKNFKYIENIITSKNYDNSTFEKFYSELVYIEEYSTLEYFYDNFSNQIYDKYFYLSVYNLCADSTQLPLIKKLSKDKEFIKNENADHYILRALQKENYDIVDYFLENFSLEDEHQCKRILYNIIADGKSEYFDIFYKKYFSKRDVEILSYLFKNENGNTAFIKLLEKNSKMAFYFISVFRLENYLIKNIDALKLKEHLKDKILKQLHIINATKNF